MTPLTSAIAIIGSTRQKSRNSVKKMPKLPIIVSTSTYEGRYDVHDDGRKSRYRPLTMIVKRSNHMPMLTKIESTNIAGTLRRIFFDQKSCGVSMLQPYMRAAAHHIGPNMRFQKWKRSHFEPEYQA